MNRLLLACFPSPRLVSSLTGMILLALFSSGCKSIKKAKQLQTVSVMASAATESLDSMVFQLSEVAKEVEEIEITEVTEQKFVPADSSGFTIFKPITISTKTTKSTRTSDSIKNESEVKVDSFSATTARDSTYQFSDLDKASQGQDPIESVASAIFPKWGKILASILMAVVPVVWGIWRKNKEKEL